MEPAPFPKWLEKAEAHRIELREKLTSLEDIISNAETIKKEASDELDKIEAFIKVLREEDAPIDDDKLIATVLKVLRETQIDLTKAEIASSAQINKKRVAKIVKELTRRGVITKTREEKVGRYPKEYFKLQDSVIEQQ